MSLGAWGKKQSGHSGHIVGVRCSLCVNVYYACGLAGRGRVLPIRRLTLPTHSVCLPAYLPAPSTTTHTRTHAQHNKAALLS